MKKFIKINIAFIIILLGTIGLVKAAKIKANSNYLTAITPKKTEVKANINYLVGVKPKTSQDLDALSNLGYEINVPAKPAVISQDEAVKSAVKIYPGLKGNNNYTIEYQVLTLPGFNAFSQEALQKNPVLNSKKSIDHLPVYIISYKNMLVPFHSCTGSKLKPQDSSVPQGYRKCEYNIVVDSTSGVTLLTFSYR